MAGEHRLRSLAKEIARLTTVELARLQQLIKDETEPPPLAGVREPVAPKPPWPGATADENDYSQETP